MVVVLFGVLRFVLAMVGVGEKGKGKREKGKGDATLLS
jgi:hypothetical protein